ncbi:MAG TPA: arginine deiminase family protein [Vicinamibacterales bacterium]|nr:arginine deiminase family protein [Vicinamibacterales bacterium]
MTAFNEFDPLRRVALMHARDAFGDDARLERDWHGLNFTALPDIEWAIEQYDLFLDLIRSSGARIDELPASAELTLDAIYVRDASIVTPRGVVLCRMGKPERRDEPAAQRRAFESLGIAVAGAIEAPGEIEGGDVVWFDERTVAVARGYRTNDAGIRQFRDLLGPHIDVIVVPLPHYRGPADVFHLMSIVSPVDRDLAVVYSRLMPVPFREWLCERGIRLVEVPDEEFESMGTNVLALSPRRCVMVDGNPITRKRLEAAGADVATYDGSEISLKGGGGPTCLTRPLGRGSLTPAAGS